MKLPFLRTQYNYDMNKAGDESGLKCEDKTLAQQQFKDEVDINTIVERFGLTGQLPDDVRTPQYGDYEGVFDFQTAMNAVREAQENFMELPAKTRARFHNDPQELLEFLDEEQNRPEAVKLGLVKEAQAPIEEALQAARPSAASSPGATAPDPK